MNTRQAFTAAALALLASSAFAGGEFDPLTGFGPAPVKSTPRVAVTQADRAAVERFDAGTAYAQAPKASANAGLTRAEVRAEFLRARNEGELVSFDTGLAYAQAPTRQSSLTREQVREETRLALRANESGVRNAKAGS
ncbi:DUF4148 domain-containing protein [Rhizobacter sp. Root1221]|uniref:DUF4148 domain-containing protein n=1 Tax=Rhizobacter sp. Root1221 TaxID=1736433 RepID=UPI0006F206B8|nr:DUF4148 domain-containing protein [Rhizobacter sp. Root1221]KQV95164.1 hypothetical protein ASC87_25225 [Rhizobacter sp. Root1221]